MQSRSPWKIVRTTNNSSYPYNIHGYRDQFFDPLLIPPTCLLHATCTDPRLPFDDFIIGRHLNNTSQYEGVPIISVMISARPCVAIKFFELVRKDLLLETNFIDDKRIRLGITTPCSDQNLIDVIIKLFNTVQETAPLPPEFYQALKLMLNRNFEREAIESIIPFDAAIKPAYFKTSQSPTVNMGSYFDTFENGDEEFTQNTPLIHQATLEGDEQQVADWLAEQPGLANLKDPWGVPAHMLAFKIGSQSMYKLFVDARNKLASKPVCEQVSTLIEPPVRRNRIKPPINFHKNPSSYYALQQTPKHRRSALHQAVIAGQLEEVKSILANEPQRLNEQDPRGYTPLLLAAAKGHAHIVRWLLSQGACHQHSVTQQHFVKVTLRLLDNVKTPEVMQAVLRVRAEQNEIYDRLLQAVRENDIRMARYISYYITQWSKKEGFTAIELAIQLSSQFGAEMTQTLLMSHEDYLPEEPYDVDFQDYMRKIVPHPEVWDLEIFNMQIPRSVFQCLTLHNKRLHDKSLKKDSKVKLIHDVLDNVGLVSEFFAPGLRIVSIVSRCSAVKDTSDIDDLYYKTFSLISNDTPENRAENLKRELDDSEQRKTYINRFYHGDKLIGFMVYEIYEVENRLIFHGNIVANLNEKPYSEQGLMYLANRAMIAMKLSAQGKKCYLYINAMFPGLGLSSALLGDHPYYPKNITPEINDDFVAKVVAKAQEIWVDGKVQVHIKLNANRSPKLNRTVSFFRDANGVELGLGMPVCYEINDDLIAGMMKRTEANNIDARCIANFATIWQEFVVNQTPMQLRNRQKM